MSNSHFMSEASEKTLLLLKELALLKEKEHGKPCVQPAERRKRRAEISKELKEIATEKEHESD